MAVGALEVAQTAQGAFEADSAPGFAEWVWRMGSAAIAIATTRTCNQLQRRIGGMSIHRKGRVRVRIPLE